MAFPKNDLFPVFDQRVSTFARALGHPARSWILRLLEEQGSKQVRDLVQLLPLSEGAITEHLRKLRHAGLVDVEVIRLMNYYSPNKVGQQAMRAVQAKLHEVLRIENVGMESIKDKEQEEVK